MNERDKSYYFSHLASRDQLWASIRSYRANIDPIVTGEKFPMPSDLNLMFNCMYLVLMELDIFTPSSYLSTSDKNNAQHMSIEDKIKSVNLETTLLKTIYSKHASMEFKERSIDTLKQTIWKNLRSKKVDVMRVMMKFPNVSEAYDIHILHQCILAILYILEIDDKEIDILSSIV